jgi:methionyl-tRNA formyltransferase
LRPLAAEHGIPVLEVNNINKHLDTLRRHVPDYLFVIGWSQLIKQELIDLPNVGSVGFHPALLPQNRGRALVPWTILTGMTRSGVSLFYIDAGVDSGDIIRQVSYAVAPDETAQTLYAKALAGLRQIIADIAPTLKTGEPLPATPQNHALATYFAKRTPADGWIDWHYSTHSIWTLIRATGKPYPGAFTVYEDVKLTIWEARPHKFCVHTGTIGQILTRNDDGSVTVQCGDGHLDLLRVQPDGGDEQSAAAYFTRVHDRLGIDVYKLWAKQHE